MPFKILQALSRFRLAKNISGKHLETPRHEGLKLERGRMTNENSCGMAPSLLEPRTTSSG